MNISACALAFLLGGAWLPAGQSPEERVEWLRTHAVELKTAAPDAVDSSDLRPLAQAIGDARVVQLGEQTHGDGTAFLLRTRVVRYLHDALAFDALAFESGLYEGMAVDEALRDPAVDLHDAVARGVYPIWAESRQMVPLFEYLRSTSDSVRPLRYFGYDVQFSRPSTAAQLLRDLTPYLAQSPARRDEDQARLAGIIKASGGAGQFPIDVETHRQNQRLLDELQALARESTNGAWWERVVIGLRHQEMSIHLGSLAPPFNPARMEESVRSPYRILASSERDLGMAENLLWWLDGPGAERRVVVWAAINHVAHASRRVAWSAPDGDGEPPTYVPAGSHIRRALGDDVYTILTVSYAGRWAAPSIRTAEGDLTWTNGDHRAAETDSLADLLHRTGRGLAFLDVRAVRADHAHWLNQPIVIRQDVFGGEAVVLSEYCDGVLFIDIMAPSEPRR